MAGRVPPDQRLAEGLVMLIIVLLVCTITICMCILMGSEPHPEPLPRNTQQRELLYEEVDEPAAEAVFDEHSMEYRRREAAKGKAPQR